MFSFCCLGIFQFVWTFQRRVKFGLKDKILVLLYINFELMLALRMDLVLSIMVNRIVFWTESFPGSFETIENHWQWFPYNGICALYGNVLAVCSAFHGSCILAALPWVTRAPMVMRAVMRPSDPTILASLEWWREGRRSLYTIHRHSRLHSPYGQRRMEALHPGLHATAQLFSFSTLCIFLYWLCSKNGLLLLEKKYAVVWSV